MASILRNFFSSKSATGSTNNRVKGHSYDSAVALEAPVKGSYPVAGNGPNVLEDFQRSRAHRESRPSTARPSTARPSTARPQTGVADAPNVPRYREDVVQRPRTAPHDGTGNAGHDRWSSRNGSMSWVGRTRSGFSSKSPPSLFRSGSQKSRNNSMRSTTEHPFPALPVVSNSTGPQVYQPKTGAGPGPDAPSGFILPFAQHMRNPSTSSHKSYVDLLDAHSTIRPETSKHRAKASGVRDYGEDVADRNISRFGPNSNNATQLDLNSPQFSYMKTVYAPKKTPLAGVAEDPKTRPSHSRVSSALGHVLGEDELGDDIPPRGHGNSPSIRSAASTPRSHPFRTESSSTVSYSTASTRGRVRDEDRPPSSKALSSQDQKSRALQPSSQSNTVRSTNQQPDMRQTLRKLLRSKQNLHQSSNQSSTQSQVLSEKFLREPPPVAASIQRPQPPQPPPKDDPTTTTDSSGNHSVKRIPSLPVNNESSVHQPVSIISSTNGHKKSKSGSVSYSTFPNTSTRSRNNSQTDRTELAVRSLSTSKTNKRQGMILENSSVPPNLDGIVDLSNTVDTEVITKTLPAVTHEHVIPIQREIIEERIIREIHTHEVRHHILPVIDTEILPAKHYIPSPDGKGLIEIPEPQVPAHKLTGRMNGNWSFSTTPRVRTSSWAQSPASHQSGFSEYESAEAPVIGLARGEAETCSKTDTRATRSLKNLFVEPILVSKKEYMTKDNFPRTEYLWRHPPVFEDALGRTQPIMIGAELGNPNASRKHFFEDGLRSEDFKSTRGPREEDSLFFRDSGYGSQGILPGISPRSPISDSMYGTESVGRHSRRQSLPRRAVGNVNIASNAESEARWTHRSADMSNMGTRHMREENLANGMQGMRV